MTYKELLATLQGDRTQAELAALLGVSQSTISRICTGESTPSREFITNLVRAFPDHRSMILDVFFAVKYANPHTPSRISIQRGDQ